MSGARTFFVVALLLVTSALLVACQPRVQTIVTIIPATPAVTIQIVTATPEPTLTPPPPTVAPTVPPVLPTMTLIPTIALPTVKPTVKPVPTLPKPTVPSVPPTAKPPASGQGDVIVTVTNTFPDTCRVVLWGPADVTLDAGSGGGTATRTIKPGTYGWRAFIGGASTGQADNMVAPPGSRCQFLCDGPARMIRWGCN